MESITYETSAESASNFMRWVERRLAKEVETNEKHAKDTKQPPVIIAATSSVALYKLSPSEKTCILQRVDTLRDERITVEEACKIVGLHSQTYNKWRRSLGMPKYKRT